VGRFFPVNEVIELLAIADFGRNRQSMIGLARFNEFQLQDAVMNDERLRMFRISVERMPRD